MEIGVILQRDKPALLQGR